MERHDSDRFKAALARVILLTGKQEKPDKAVIREYWLALKEFQIDTIEEVADRICTHETTLISLPPPGRWRQIARELFELRPTRPRHPGDERCQTCDGTNWRIAYTQGRRIAVKCDHDGTPDEDPPGELPRAVSMYDALEGEIGPPPGGGETAIAERRRTHGNLILHCMCCGEPYRVRTGRRCACVTPPGMTPTKWLKQGHKDCPNPIDGAAGKGNTRCRNHCGCTPEERQRPRPKFFPLPAEGQHVDAFLKKQGLRDADAPGPSDEPPLQEPADVDDDLGF